MKLCSEATECTNLGALNRLRKEVACLSSMGQNLSGPMGSSASGVGPEYSATSRGCVTVLKFSSQKFLRSAAYPLHLTTYLSTGLKYV